MTEESRQAPTAEGSLERTPFAHLLVYVADRQLTGSIVLSDPGKNQGEEHVIYFLEGAPSKIRTGESSDHLGRVLFESGVLDEEALNASLVAIAEGTELQGEYLVRMGAIDRTQLMAGLRAQAIRKMAYVFTLPSATSFAFYQDVNLLESWGGPEIIPLDPLPAVWAAVCARGNEPLIDATLDRLGDMALKLHEQSDVTRFAFSPQEMAIVNLIRARACSLGTLVASDLLPGAHIKLVVYALLITRHLDHRADSALPVGIQRLGDTARFPLGSSGVPLARVKLRRAEAPPEDRHPSQAAAAPPAPAATLTTSTGASAAATIASPQVKALPPNAHAEPSVEQAARRTRVLERAAAIDREDYFTILGLTKTSNEAEAQTAYYALAKHWHPDRLPSEIADARDAASKVFARMSEAFETLSDPSRRARYVEVMKGGGGTHEEAEQIQQIIDAATDFQRAEILWKKRDPAAAEFIMRAYNADPEQADYIALFATLELSKRAADAPVDDLIKLCDSAIDRSERCERAYFCRARLRKRIGKIDAAMMDFRAAYELNPKNLDAAREVRVYEMRRAKDGRRSTPASRRSTPPSTGKSNPPGRNSTPPRRSSTPAGKKDTGVLSGIGKLFKR